jgi:hypothetical protein
MLTQASWHKNCSRSYLLQMTTELRLPQTEPEHEVLKQILSYFVRNRKAADSLEGVTRWRLMEEQVHRTLQQTETALKWLVTQGFLQEVQTTRSSPIFRLDPKRYTEAVHFLAEEGRRKKRKRPRT